MHKKSSINALPLATAPTPMIAINDTAPDTTVDPVLLQSKERLDLVVKLAGLAIVEVDYTTNTVQLSDEAAILFGLPTEPAIVSRQTIHNLFHPDDRDELLRKIEGSLDPVTGGELTVEHRIVRPDGGVRWLNVRKQIFFAQNGDGVRVPVRSLLVALDITDRKQAEQQLAFHASLLDFAYDAVVATDREQKLTAWNRGAEEMFGWSAAEALGYRASELLRSSMSSEWRAEALRQMQAGNRVKVETTVHHRDGTPILIEGYNVAIYDTDGQITGYMSISRDIRQRKAAEAALQQREERLRLTLKATELGLWEIKPLTDETYWSPEMKAIYGLSPATPVNRQSTVQYAHPADQERVQAMRLQVLRAGVDHSFELEHRILRSDGVVRWVDLRGQIFFAEVEGKVQPVRGLGTLRDITERKTAEEALRQQTERLHRAQAAARIGIWDWNLRNKEALWTPEAWSLLEPGGTGAVTYERWQAAIHPLDRAQASAAVTAAIEKGGDYRHEFRVVHPDGTILWLESRGRTEYDSEGPCVMRGTIQDITERKESELDAKFLTQVAGLMQQASQGDELLQQTTAALCAYLQVDRCSFRQVNAEQTHFVAVQGVDRNDYLPDLQDIPIADLLTPALIDQLRRGNTIVIPDVSDENLLPATTLEGYRIAGVQSFVNTPYLRDGVWVASLSIMRSAAYSWRKREIHLLETIKERLWLALEKLHLAQQLQQRQAQLNTILHNIPAAVYMLTTDHRYLFINRYFEMENKITDAEICGQSIYDRFSPAIADSLAAHEQQALAAKAPVAIEEAAPRDGAMRYYSTIKAPLLNEAGEPYAIIGISTDITERKRAEEALRQSEERYRTLFETMDEGFCIFEMIFDEANKPLDYRFLEINPAFARFTGLEDAVGKTARQLVPNLEQHWFEIYGAVALSGEPRRFIEGSAAMGSWFEVYAFRFGEPESRRVALLFNNITERKQAEDEVQRSRNLLQRMAEASPDNINIYDLRQQQIIYSNRKPSMSDFSGQTTWNTTPAEIDSHVHPDDILAMQAEFQRIHTVSDGEVVETIFRWREPDGNYRWLQDRTVVFARDEQGQVTQHLSISSDITEHKQAELNQQFLLDLDAQVRLFNNADTILQMTVERLGEYLGVTQCAIKEVDTDANQVYILVHWRSKHEGTDHDGVDPLSATMRTEIAHTLVSGQNVVINDVADDSRTIGLADDYAAAGVQSMARIPFQLKDALLAVLSVADEQARTWRRDEIILLENIIARIWPLVIKARSEAALRHQEEFVRQIADNVPGLIAYVGADERYRFVNASYEQWFQRPRQQIIDQNIQALVGGDIYQRLSYRQKALAGENVVFEETFDYPDGVRRTVWGRYQPNRAVDGAVSGFYVFVMDISERTRAEQALRENETRLRLALAGAGAGGWEYDLRNDQARWSPEMFQLYGLSPEKGAPSLAQFSPFVHEEDRARTAAEMAAAAQQGGAFAIEFRTVHPDGRLLWINSSGVVELDETGSPLAARGIDQDISTRKQAEMALQQSNAILNGVIESSKDALFVRDLTGRYLLVNSTGAEQVRMDKEALIGKSYRELFSAAEVMTIEADDRPVLAQGLTQSLDHVTEHDTIKRYWHTLKMPLRSAAGDIIGLISSARDVTERKRTEMHQQFFSDLFIQLRLLSNSDLMMEQLVKRLGQHLGVMSCRMNTIDLASAQFTIQKNWSADGLEVAGVYPLAELAPAAILAELQAGQTVVVTNTATDPRTASVVDNYRTEQVTSFIGVPIFQQGEWRASLSIKGAGERLWSVDEIALLESVANQFGSLLEKTQAEEALRLSEARFRQLADAMPQIVWRTNGAGQVEYLNQQWLDYTGLTQEESLRAPNQVIHPDDVPTAVAAWQRAQELKTAYEFEMRLRRYDGVYRWFLARTVPVRNEADEIVHWYGASTDISAIKQTEEALRQSEARYRAVVQSSSQIIWTAEAQSGRSDEANLWMEAFTGRQHPPQEEGAWWMDEIHPDERTAIKQAANHAMRQKEPLVCEFRLQHLSGDYRYVLLRNVPIFNADGTLREWVGTLADIHERRQVQEQLRQSEEKLRLLNADLEQRVEERTQQLAAKNWELERSNRELDKFAYVASHDLKSPLRAIDSLAHWISADAGPVLPEESKIHLQKMQGRVKRMEKLLDDLLAYSRAGRFQYKIEKVDVKTIVQDTIDLLAPPQSEGPRFTFTLEGEVPVYIGQRVPLETVLRNLISNAIKHHDRLDGHVHVLMRDAGEQIDFAISDDGPGIEAQFHTKIFEMFQTLQPRDKVEGSGMGLAIVQKLIESLGGSITVESAVGAGATFRFTWMKR